MKTTLLLCLLTLLLGACSERDSDLRGTLGEGWPDEALFASAGAGFPPALIENGTFAFSDVPAGPVDLRISSGEEEIAWIEIRGLPGGATLSLERIRLDRKREFAFPAAVRMDGADRVTINGIRRGNPEVLPSRVDATGAVLAISKDASALIIRPQSERLPDLPVVITPATLVTDTSGNDASLEHVSAGDTIRVEGRTESGYVFADRITPGGGSGDPPSSLSPEDQGTSERGATSAGTGAQQVQARQQEREEEKRDEKKDKRDEKRSEERRRSESRRFEIPNGHRPPPGECRDWIPGLPPGQQPPPRKC